MNLTTLRRIGLGAPAFVSFHLWSLFQDPQVHPRRPAWNDGLVKP